MYFSFPILNIIPVRHLVNLVQTCIVRCHDSSSANAYIQTISCLCAFSSHDSIATVNINALYLDIRRPLKSWWDNTSYRSRWHNIAMLARCVLVQSWMLQYSPNIGCLVFVVGRVPCFSKLSVSEWTPHFPSMHILNAQRSIFFLLHVYIYHKAMHLHISLFCMGWYMQPYIRW